MLRHRVLWCTLASATMASGCSDAAGGPDDVALDTMITTTDSEDATGPEIEVDAGEDVGALTDATSATDATDATNEPDAVADAALDGEDAADVDAVTYIDADDVGPDTSPSAWRSALYPAAWTPATTHASGAFLHDFSWAGYRHGEAALGAGIGDDGLAGLSRFDVTTYGAVAVALDGAASATDATDAFQAAIDAARDAGGGLVHAPAGLYRIDGQLRVQASRIVIAGDGAAATRLWFTKGTGMSFDAHLRFSGASTTAGESALTADALARSHVLSVTDTSAFVVGDDVQVGQVITPGFVAEHGMTNVWQAFNGTWQPFFHRTVTAVDHDALTVTIDVPLRYPMKTSHQASLRRVTGLLREVGLQDVGIANAIGFEAAWALDQVHAVAFEHVADAWVSGVETFPSPGAPTEGLGAGTHLISSGILVLMSKRMTIADTHLARAQHRGSGGNGYLFELRQASEVLTRDSSGTLGRHNFIQNWGFGATGNVWLRVASSGGENVISPELGLSVVASSEYHHSLATANLFDHSRADDGLKAVNRGTESTGAGHAATECVFWNTAGARVTSRQFGLGYIIGTTPEVAVSTLITTLDGIGTGPEDWREGEGLAATLEPQSLYEDQLARRLARQSR